MLNMQKNIAFTVLTDIVIFMASAFIACGLYGFHVSEFLVPLIVFSILAIYILFLKGYYSIRKYNFFFKDAYLLFEGLLIAYLLTFMTISFAGMDKSVFHFLIAELFISFAILYVSKIFIYKISQKQPCKNILIVGSASINQLLSKAVLGKEEYTLKVADTIEDESQIKEIKGIDVVIAESGFIDKLRKLFSSRVEVVESIRAYELLENKLPVELLTQEYFDLHFKSSGGFVKVVLKRIFDIIASIVILTLTMPILVLIAIGVKLYDNGPIMYEQQRVGKDNKPFKIYKLRTMCIGADKAGMVDKGNTKDDRIIPFCRFVRKARFDEIPQMINILKGQMSVVGPRAEFLDFVRKYDKEIPFYGYRHSITPGWTGWAQINQGHCVNIEDITEKLRYDLFYIKNRNNIFWDLSILFKAVAMALSGRHS